MKMTYFSTFLMIFFKHKTILDVLFCGATLRNFMEKRRKRQSWYLCACGTQATGEEARGRLRCVALLLCSYCSRPLHAFFRSSHSSRHTSIHSFKEGSCAHSSAPKSFLESSEPGTATMRCTVENSIFWRH